MCWMLLDQPLTRADNTAAGADGSTFATMLHFGQRNANHDEFCEKGTFGRCMGREARAISYLHRGCDTRYLNGTSDGQLIVGQLVDLLDTHHRT